MCNVLWRAMLSPYLDLTRVLARSVLDQISSKPSLLLLAKPVLLAQHTQRLPNSFQFADEPGGTRARGTSKRQRRPTQRSHT